MTNEVLLSILGSIGLMVLSLIAWGIKQLVIAVFNNTQELKIISEKLQNFITEANSEISLLKKDVADLYRWKYETEHRD